MRKLIPLVIVLMAFSCRDHSKMQRTQEQYQVVQEGSANGASSTINGAEEVRPPVTTDTSADTTTAFALPAAAGAAPVNPNGSIASTMPQQSSGSMPVQSVPVQAAPQQPRPHVEHPREQRPAQTDTTASQPPQQPTDTTVTSTEPPPTDSAKSDTTKTDTSKTDTPKTDTTKTDTTNPPPPPMTDGMVPDVHGAA